MGMTPSRRTIEKITLGDLAVDNRVMVVKCNLCRRTSHFLTRDLVQVYGENRKMHDVFDRCSQCGRSNFLVVGTRLPGPEDEGTLKVRRPTLVRVQWSWREETYQDPNRRPRTAREFVTRSRGYNGMGHNHGEPFTIDQVVIMSRLRKLGLQQPTFATRAELEQWIDENRHRVERPDDAG